MYDKCTLFPFVRDTVHKFTLSENPHRFGMKENIVQQLVREARLQGSVNHASQKTREICHNLNKDRNLMQRVDDGQTVSGCEGPGKPKRLWRRTRDLWTLVHLETSPALLTYHTLPYDCTVFGVPFSMKSDGVQDVGSLCTFLLSRWKPERLGGGGGLAGFAGAQGNSTDCILHPPALPTPPNFRAAMSGTLKWKME